MWTLWALAVVLAIKAGALDVPQVNTVLESLPVGQDSNSSLKPVPVSVLQPQVVRSPTVQRNSPPRKSRVGNTKGKCKSAVKYFVSSSKLDDYLNATLPPQIEKLLKCEDVNIAGILGSALSVLGDSNLLSLLDVTSVLDIGGGGLGGILGKGGSSGKPLDSLSQATGAVSNLLPLNQDILGGIVPGGPDKNPVKGLLDSTGVSGLQEPLSDVVEKANGLKESTKDVVKGALPPDVKDAVSGLLGNINLEELLLGLEVQEVTVDSMESSVAGNEIHVRAATTATIGGKGIAGPVVSLLGFQVKSDTTLTIAISANNTQCVNLEVQETHINVKKVTLQIEEMITGIVPVPIPIPLPLGDLILQLLSVELNKKVQETDSCDIVLNDFNDCKNSTGLFKFQLKSSRISPQGLSIFYCAEAIFGKNTVPVAGSILPPDPKNANISITLSHTMLKTIVTYAAKISSVKVSVIHMWPPSQFHSVRRWSLSTLRVRRWRCKWVQNIPPGISTTDALGFHRPLADNLEASITKITYTFQPDSTIQASYWTDIRKNEESYATGKTVSAKKRIRTRSCSRAKLLPKPKVQSTLIISHECKISKDKMTVNIKLSDEVQDLLSGVLKKLLSAAIVFISEWSKQWNVPVGVTSQPLIDAKVIVIKSVRNSNFFLSCILQCWGPNPRPSTCWASIPQTLPFCTRGRSGLGVFSGIKGTSGTWHQSVPSFPISSIQCPHSLLVEMLFVVLSVTLHFLSYEHK
ncbi:vomeromodulin-like [Ictidomys tridecemlineatus]|nr:vomeromodulin-like [Ictidomys tridecemlineatus]